MTDKDSDTIGGEPTAPDTFNNLIIHAGGQVRWRFFILMFIVFMVMMTDIFEDKILTRFDGAVIDGCKTFYGNGITGLLLVFVCIIIDAALNISFV
jgi:hypothetical protein